MSALGAAGLMALALVAGYRSATARYGSTWALGVTISGLAAANAYALAASGWL